MLLKEKFIALEKNMIEKTCILKVLVNDDCLFFWCKSLAYFFCNSKKQACKSKTEFTNISQSIGGKNRRLTQMCFSSAGAFKVIYHICFAIPPKKYRSPFRYICITQRRQSLKFVWCTIFCQNFKESTPYEFKKQSPLSDTYMYLRGEW